MAPPPSVKYDPANAGRVELRTWRLIYEHLRVIQRSSTAARHKLLLAGSELDRFGVRERRLMAAEVYHSGRYLAVRSRHRMRSYSLSDGAR